MGPESYGMLAALVGLAGGCALGLAGRLGDFCTLGAIETARYGGDQRRLRLWGIVLAVAILATQAGAAAGLIDLTQTAYHSVQWSFLGTVLGGLAFGYGMAMAGNCGFGALVRFGSGDLRSLVIVVVMGVFGYVALSGPLAPLRDALFPQPPAAGPQGPAALIAGGAPLLQVVLALAVALPLAAWALSHAPLRCERGMIAWGAVAGLSVAAMLAGTSWISSESLGAIVVEGPSYTAPVGRSILYLMTSTAGGLSFSVGSVAGVLIGGFAGSMLRGRFRWEACEDPRELGRQVGGAALMGIGGVVAMGCSIGQGLTGFATLAWSGPLTLAAIAAGALFGLRHLIVGFQPD